MRELVLSPLGHTWLLDLDGTILKHNGHLEGGDVMLPGALEFFAKIPAADKIIFLTSRDREYAAATEMFLKSQGIRFDLIVYNLPYGERILINDAKPSGLATAIGVNLERNAGISVSVRIDESL